MSHFTVLVIGPEDEVESQLAPFQENNMGDCPAEYMEFNDMEDEFLEEYNNESTEKVLMPDGRTLSPWDDELKTGEKDESGIMGTRAMVLPPKAVKKEMPFKQLYKTFEEFVEGWHGHEERYAGEGRYGYHHNPNCKWDWQ